MEGADVFRKKLATIGNPFTDVYSNLFEVKVSKVEQIDLPRKGAVHVHVFLLTKETSMPAE